MPPHGGGWGLIRYVQQLPDSVVLMAAPPVCARITGLRELRLRYRNRFFFLNIGEGDFTGGRHEDLVLQAVDEIMVHMDKKPKILFFCETCLDEIIGSDYRFLMKQAAEKHGIRAATLHIKPLSAEGRRPSGLLSMQAVFDLISDTDQRDSGINLLGSIRPIDRESEFYSVLDAAGIGPLRHMADCQNIEDFDAMGKSAWNIMLFPGVRLAVQRMEERFGMPSVHLPVAYGMDTIEKNYDLLEGFTGRPVQAERYREEAMDFLEEKIPNFTGMTAAVGAGIYAGTFELARALTEYGLHVKYIFANVVIDFDTEHLEWLKEYAPHIIVYPRSHTTMAEFYGLGKTVDLAFGFDAGYFCSGAKTVALDAEKLPFGYQAVKSLYSDMETALGSPLSHREAMYASLCCRDTMEAAAGVGEAV
jgi:nitrogenase molybdenum-cofactor synthesis protein NifE